MGSLKIQSPYSAHPFSRLYCRHCLGCHPYEPHMIDCRLSLSAMLPHGAVRAQFKNTASLALACTTISLADCPLNQRETGSAGFNGEGT